MTVLEIQYRNLSVFTMFRMKTATILILLCLGIASIVMATDKLIWYDTNGELIQSKKLDGSVNNLSHFGLGSSFG